VHKAFVDLNEKGTEAAAATAVSCEAKSAVRPPPPAIFRADRPFLFMIRDRKTGSILFIGRITNPKGLSPAVRATEMERPARKPERPSKR
jgi:serine protease inhibitor